VKEKENENENENEPPNERSEGNESTVQKKEEEVATKMVDGCGLLGRKRARAKQARLMRLRKKKKINAASTPTPTPSPSPFTTGSSAADLEPEEEEDDYARSRPGALYFWHNAGYGQIHMVEAGKRAKMKCEHCTERGIVCRKQKGKGAKCCYECRRDGLKCSFVPRDDRRRTRIVKPCHNRS
jgi:hypothetical protein